MSSSVPLLMLLGQLAENKKPNPWGGLSQRERDFLDALACRFAQALTEICGRSLRASHVSEVSQLATGVVFTQWSVLGQRLAVIWERIFVDFLLRSFQEVCGGETISIQKLMGAVVSLLDPRCRWQLTFCGAQKKDLNPQGLPYWLRWDCVEGSFFQCMQLSSAEMGLVHTYAHRLSLSHQRMQWLQQMNFQVVLQLRGVLPSIDMLKSLTPGQELRFDFHSAHKTTAGTSSCPHFLSFEYLDVLREGKLLSTMEQPDLQIAESA